MEKTIEQWGVDSQGEKVFLVNITNSKGHSVALSNYGARVVSIIVPDKDGTLENVVLGYDSLADYIKGNEFFGASIGRYANRIANGKFTLEGVTYTLDKNHGEHHLHGGVPGFSHRTWKMMETDEPNSFAFRITSPRGEGGYPASVITTITYTWSDDSCLNITMQAIADAETVVSLTHHSYFNLGGEGAGNIENQTLMLKSSFFLETDDKLIPTGNFVLVDKTVMDFREPVRLKQGLDSAAKEIAIADGYDHCWIVDGYKGELIEVASLTDSVSGRVMKVRSTLPGMQVYTSNGLTGIVPGRTGQIYKHRDAVCIEPQLFPDSPNHANFPSSVLSPEEPFDEIIEYSFSCM